MICQVISYKAYYPKTPYYQISLGHIVLQERIDGETVVIKLLTSYYVYPVICLVSQCIGGLTGSSFIHSFISQLQMATASCFRNNPLSLYYFYANPLYMGNSSLVDLTRSMYRQTEIGQNVNGKAILCYLQSYLGGYIDSNPIAHCCITAAVLTTHSVTCTGVLSSQ